MQVAIIIMTYLTLLAVMALLKIQFLDTMSGLGGQNIEEADQFAGSIDTEFMSMLFFHAVTMQAIISSFIAGYIRNVDLISGVKYAVILVTIALITWIVVEQISSPAAEGEALLLLVGSAGVSGRTLYWRVRRTLGQVRDRTSRESSVT
jgi:flagellar protein FlaJ